MPNTGATLPQTAANESVGGASDWENVNNILGAGSPDFNESSSEFSGSGNVDCDDLTVYLTSGAKQSSSIITATPWNRSNAVGDWVLQDHGGDGVLWGQSWSLAEVNSSAFTINIRATAGSETTGILKASNFGFAISSGNATTGIRVQIAKRSSYNSRDGTVTAHVAHVLVTVYYSRVLELTSRFYRHPHRRRRKES